MTRFLLLNLIFISFSTLPMFGQTNTEPLRGVVLDSKTNEGIPFCTIVIEGTNKGVHSNENGEFGFSKIKKGKYKLQIVRTGYINKTVEADWSNQNNITVYLEENEIKLDEVLITGQSESTEMETQGFSSKSIKTEKIEIQSIELSTLLDQTSGINVRQEGGLGSRTRYSINGLSGNAVRFFIDGVPMEYYGQSYSINSLPVNLIEELEVYKGVVPVNLGSDALGGAINIKTKSAKKSSLNFSYSAGSFNTHQVALNGGYRNQKNGLTFRGSLFYNYSDNNYEVWGDDVYVVDPNTGRVDRSVKAKRFNDAYEAYGTKVDFGFTDVKWADQLLISMVYSDMYKEVQHGATMNVPYGERFYTQGNVVPSINYQKKDLFVDGLDVSLFSSYAMNTRTLVDTTTNKYNWYGEVWAQNPGGGEAGNPTHSTTDEGTLINRFNTSYSFNDNNIINFNAVITDYKRTAFNREAPIGQDTRNNYSKMNKNILGLSYSNTAVDGRLRTNIFGKYYGYNVNVLDHEYRDGEYYPIYNSTSDVNYGYGIATSYDLFNKLTLQFSAEQAVRLPEPDELFGNYAANVNAAIDLKPEISKNLNLGIRYGELNFNEHSLTFSTTFFFRDVENMIQQSTQVVSGVEVYVNENFGEILSKGLDFQIDYDYNRKFEAIFSGSYNDTRYMSEYDIYGRKNMYYGSRLKNAPFLQFNSSFKYHLNDIIKNKGDLSVYWNIRYIHEYYRHWENIGSDNKDMIPTQFVNDLGASYRFPKNKLAISLDVKNLFNEQVFDNFAIQQPGRGVYFKINYSIL
ncbi:TonB-dependent receptor [Flammeovirga sp. SubArs3]|uniref:TonB-dependent receptor n=1 Tax=Flammeovirga sp. SubArs3 TaxID=2995316 RepID=UPI00248CD594|nr:TonB-dependent receptor [Flammeovirga sp. SubArs3]